jgi:hypothetical protein
MHHSDCDGEIAWEDCAKIADRLEAIAPLIENTKGGVNEWRDTTLRFAAGLRRAHAAHENVEFH